MSGATDTINVYGARQHNLKNIDLKIPKNKLVVFTGVSGSGKSSLAMDTVYAEGQRRYVESLSAYARQFLGVMDKPDVDRIEGLSPAIAIDQKTTSRNPRSTVGTVTEIYDFLRLLFARVGHPHCPQCGREISRQSPQQIADRIFELVALEPAFKSPRGVRVVVLAPIVRDRKGEYSALFENLKKQGIIRARIDGVTRELSEHFELIKTNKHSVDAIVGRFILTRDKLKNDRKDTESGVYQAVEAALRLASGNAVVSIVRDKAFDFTTSPVDFEDHLFSENFACPVCNLSLPDLEPRTFSFNSPHGACPRCDGLGTQLEVDEALIINPRLSIKEGGVFPWARLFEHNSWTSMVINAVAKEYGFLLDEPIGSLKKQHYTLLLFGAPGKKFRVEYTTKDGNTGVFNARFEGVIPNLKRRYAETKSDFIRQEIEKYMINEPCNKCGGTRLKDEALSVVVVGKNINQVTNLSIQEVYAWTVALFGEFSEREKIIAQPILKEITYRLQFLLDVGLSYLTLSRAAANLSGGEAQRIRLASQIGSGLSGVLYVLDEPSVGLHQKDQYKLLQTLKHLRDLGNTVLVVEHDTETMLESDYIFDIGPGAGEHGGRIIAQGYYRQIMKDPNSLTGKYLSGKRVVGEEAQKYLRQLSLDEPVNHNNAGKYLKLHKAFGHNLKGIDFDIPLGRFVCVTGVSGSGKSTLVMDTLLRAMRQDFGLKNDERPEPYAGLEGIEHVDKVIAIDQSPIGRTPKSNPATYTKAFDHIRELFSKTEEARIRGYQSGRFSFNVKGGRCEACHGEGQIRIEMQFMPDVYVSCEVCGGKRYNREALEITYKGKNISEVLALTVDDALEFFGNIPQIRTKLQTISDVGLGYIRLGQPAPTLSGGEAQRVKLASELAKRSTGKTFYILDEPTTGLHFADLERLITVMKRLTHLGNTVLIIEHNLDVISNADYVVDLGPQGGNAGGEVIFCGTLAELLKDKKSYTAQALRKMQRTQN
ncbi:MAG: UvrABC system protein A [candidate division WWE3 bacterium GW2011_GWA1_46_21]|uniref:UvrABC system protein A n=4 Tax=Katanobacteria TaxID=422282 RepID=A0A0G1PG94_UNCKA|nr:MAG: UvrABC system protein A [candidate division WWE3 bacterium GW2011_GWA1_46_21]KKU49226.1 MAG: UvrABC system protein A [candidate division WWE3 bacterium GW2011_GWA2_46_9]KKU57772.1 MAG: UvrABC system protein A [candidate division WWE3 bacterium GW2011_GWB1_47_11]